MVEYNGCVVLGNKIYIFEEYLRDTTAEDEKQMAEYREARSNLNDEATASPLPQEEPTKFEGLDLSYGAPPFCYREKKYRDMFEEQRNMLMLMARRAWKTA
ncbi:unnamed protein product [Anisakis simplex]|uniref:Pepsin-I3 domain-containing protein n=1 Tax=Anisakis simplex TaxID=6269 RepID=A0A0M3JHB8_ANISI|nr:unnamed protein product [Anisakis simplex]